jgi:hypothetical protein
VFFFPYDEGSLNDGEERRAVVGPYEMELMPWRSNTWFLARLVLACCKTRFSQLMPKFCLPTTFLARASALVELLRDSGSIGQMPEESLVVMKVPSGEMKQFLGFMCVWDNRCQNFGSRIDFVPQNNCYPFPFSSFLFLVEQMMSVDLLQGLQA